MMASIKRIFSLFLALALTTMLLPIQSVFAADGDPEFYIGDATVDISAGESTVTVPVKVKNNPGFASIQLQFGIPENWSIQGVSYAPSTTEYSIYYELQEMYGMQIPVAKENAVFMFNPQNGKLAIGYPYNISATEGTICWVTYVVPTGTVNSADGYEITISAECIDPIGEISDIKDQFTFTSGAIKVTGGIDPATLIPTISGPADAAYTYGQSASALSVTAGAETEGELTYQWYSNTENNNTDGTAITNATSATYIPSLSAFTTTYYYCVVTNTYNGRAYSATSNAAAVTYSKADQPALSFTNGGTVTYGDTLTLTTSGGTGDGTVTYSVEDGTGSATIDGGALSPTKVGTVTVKATKAGGENYNDVTAEQEITIQAADLTLNGSETYNVSVYTTRNPVTLTVPTATAKGGQTVDSTWKVISGTDKITLENGAVTATESAKAGDTATITLTYSAPNHNDKGVTYNITIQDKNDVSDEMTFTATGTTSATYDGTDKSVSTFVNAATISGYIAGTITYTVKDSTGATVVSGTELNTLKVTNAGTYTVTANYSDDENEGVKELTFVIEEATVDAPTAITNLTYNGEPQNGVSYESGKGYTMSGVLSATDAGSYTATATLDGNHKWSDGTTTEKTVEWSIVQATIDVSSWAWNYSVPFTYEKGIVRSVVLTDGDEKVNIVGYEGNSATNAGEYTATVNLSVKTEYQKNYKLSDTKLTLSWEINQKTIDVTGASWSYNGPFTYDGVEKTVTVTGVDTDEVKIEYEGNSAANAGSYTAKATFSPVDSDNCTVTGSIDDLNWVINKAAVDAPTAKEDLVYTGSAQDGVTYTPNSGYTMSGDLSATNAGSYTATATLDGNHQWSDNTTTEKTIPWSIAQKTPGTLNAEASLRYSNAEDQNFTAADIKTLLNDANADTTITITDVSTTGSNNILGKAAVVDGKVIYALKSDLTDAAANKTATITVNFSSNNYVSGTVTLTVNVMDKYDVKENISYTGSTTTYTGIALTADQYQSATVSGITVGENAQWTYIIKNSSNDVVTEMKNAGTYTVTATYEDNDNYGTAQATFTINPVQLTITGGAVTEKTYDGNTTATVTNVTFGGLVNGETLTFGTDYTVSDAAFDTANAGANENVGFTVTLNSETVQNYTLGDSSGSATGTINPKTVTVTVGEIGARAYTGSALTPDVNVTATDMIAGDTLVKDTDYTVSYAGNTNAGTATVTVSPKSGSNYAFDSVETTFIINKADPVVTANNLTVTYTGEAIPAGKISGTALFNGLVISGTWSWVTEPASNNASETAYTAAVKFTPDNTNLNESAPQTITVTINKATPTGEPAFEKINNSGKTLADVNLGVGTITPAGGVFKWVDADGSELPADTEVEANKAYTWVYTPADPDNYNELTGTVIPYEYIPYEPILGSPVAVPDTVGNGSVRLSIPYAAHGAKVVITAAPDEGYEVDTIEVRDSQGNLVAVTDNGDGTYSFVMPGTKVSVSAIFTEIKQEPAEPTEPTEPTEPIEPAELPFTDVADNAWYADAVRYVYENGLMTGTSATGFEPETITNRGMLVTILYRLEGEPAVGKAAFTDVADGQWYTDAVAWATANGIVNGYGDGAFGPNDSITREQMATILYRYAAYKGYDVTAAANLSGYTDANQISSYAADAMSWANAEGLITGVTTATLVPLGDSSRAVVATILMRFIENITK